MKLKQLFEQQVPRDDKQRQMMLKQFIDAGRDVRVSDAKYELGKFSLGDVEAIGYGEFIEERRGKYYEVSFKYWGPAPITVMTSTSDITKDIHYSRGTQLNPGEQTEPITVEYD